MPMAGQVGSWGIQQYPSSCVEPPRSIATHQKPQLGSAKFGAKQHKSSTRGRFEGVMHGQEAPHTPTNGLAVSPGILRSRPPPSRQVYCSLADPATFPCHGEGELPARPVTNFGACRRYATVHHAIGGTHARIKCPWQVKWGPGASSKTLRHAWNPPVPSPHTKNPSSEVPNLVQSSPNPARAGGLRV